jgi:hypothetical protein
MSHACTLQTRQTVLMPCISNRYSRDAHTLSLLLLPLLLQALRSMYSNSSTAAARSTSAALQQLRGEVPDPVEAYVTRWAADPYARGAYSYYAVGNPKNITGVRMPGVLRAVGCKPLALCSKCSLGRVLLLLAYR